MTKELYHTRQTTVHYNYLHVYPFPFIPFNTNYKRTDSVNRESTILRLRNALDQESKYWQKVRKILTRIKVLRVVVVHLLWSQVNTTVQRLAADKGELLRQHADEVDQYERRIRSLTEEVCWFHFNAWLLFWGRCLLNSFTLYLLYFCENAVFQSSEHLIAN